MLSAKEMINLIPNDTSKLKDNLSHSVNQFGYDYLIKNTSTIRMKTPGTDDSNAAIITFGGQINLLVNYLALNIDH